MKILLSIEHPAWAHQFNPVVKALEEKGHIIKVLVIQKDRNVELLDSFGIPYEIISETNGKNIIEKGLVFFFTLMKIFQASLKYNPDLFIGRSSPMMALNSFIFRRQHILFEDTEFSRFCLGMCRLFSDVIITPVCFLDNLGKKQYRIEAYKELFYLHPNYFHPDKKVLEEAGIEPDERYIIVRFVAWDAHHDFGHEGIKNKVEFVRELEKHCRVFITSEGELPAELERFRSGIPAEKFHDLLYYATLYVGDGGTTASEAAVLGTPAVFISPLYCGYQCDEERYGLLYRFPDQEKGTEQGLQKAVQLLNDKDLKQKAKAKREVLLHDKIDPTAFFVWLIDNYPESIKQLKEISPNQSGVKE